MLRDKLLIVQKIYQVVREALRLDDLIGFGRAKGADHSIAGTRHSTRIWIQRPRPLAKLPDEAITQTDKVLVSGLLQFEVRSKETPGSDRGLRQPSATDAAEPAKQEGRVTPGNTVGNEKINVFPKKDGGQSRSSVVSEKPCGPEAEAAQATHLRTDGSRLNLPVCGNVVTV